MYRESKSLIWIVLVSAACTASNGTNESDGSSSTASSADTTTTLTTSTTTETGTTVDASSSEASSSGTTESADDSSSTGGDVDLAGNCALDVHVGGFVAAYEQTYSAFSGTVSDGVVPLNVLEQIAEDGDCRLLRRNNPFCDPGCAAGETCDFDGNCIPYPSNHDIGVVTVTGLEKPVMIEPTPPTFSYFDTMLPHPGFEPGAIITVTSTGGDYSPITLQGIGVDMIVPGQEEIHLDADVSQDVTWTPGDPRVTMRLQIAVDQHGTSPLAMICEAPADAGTLTISGALMTEFLEHGISGFPSADFFFETVDSMDVEPGCVDFAVRSHDQIMVFITGHTPCNSTPDCPKGQTCDVMNQTCV
ncbi:MAG TPA: hypothetical protein VG755_29860 [Nannocystaceae bacterium]|nr:hypothetical protein [Nannocystaceae bacterium]